MTASGKQFVAPCVVGPADQAFDRNPARRLYASPVSLSPAGYRAAVNGVVRDVADAAGHGCPWRGWYRDEVAGDLGLAGGDAWPRRSLRKSRGQAAPGLGDDAVCGCRNRCGGSDNGNNAGAGDPDADAGSA